MKPFTIIAMLMCCSACTPDLGPPRTFPVKVTRVEVPSAAQVGKSSTFKVYFEGSNCKVDVGPLSPGRLDCLNLNTDHPQYISVTTTSQLSECIGPGEVDVCFTPLMPGKLTLYINHGFESQVDVSP